MSAGLFENYPCRHPAALPAQICNTVLNEFRSGKRRTVASVGRSADILELIACSHSFFFPYRPQASLAPCSRCRPSIVRSARRLVDFCRAAPPKPECKRPFDVGKNGEGGGDRPVDGDRTPRSPMPRNIAANANDYFNANFQSSELKSPKQAPPPSASSGYSVSMPPRRPGTPDSWRMGFSNSQCVGAFHAS